MTTLSRRKTTHQHYANVKICVLLTAWFVSRVVGLCETPSEEGRWGCCRDGLRVYQFDSSTNKYWRIAPELKTFIAHDDYRRIHSCPEGYSEDILEIPPSIHVPARARGERVDVSIIIPYFGGREYTYHCIESIIRTSGTAASYELILVDDGSYSGETTIWDIPDVIHGAKFIRNSENVGYLKSVNKALSAASGEYIALVNNDILVNDGWLSSLRKTFDEHDNVGLVGSKIVSANGKLLEACATVFSDGTPQHITAPNIDHPQHNYVRDAVYCSAAAVLVQTSAFQELGGFDERYLPAYFEDTDLCFGLRSLGLRVLYQPTSVVVHKMSSTYAANPARAAEKEGLMLSNRKKFAEKWSSELRKLYPVGTSLSVAKTWPGRRHFKRVLVVEAAFISPDKDSGSLRLLYILNIFLELGCHVTYFAEDFTSEPEWLLKITQMGVEVLHSPYVRSVSDVIAMKLSYDIFFIARPNIAEKYANAIRRCCTEAFVAYDTVDIHYKREERLLELGDGAYISEHKVNLEKVKKMELSQVSNANITVVVSQAEEKILKDEVPGAAFTIISNIHQMSLTTAPFEERKDVLFIGNMNHLPNQDAVSWYVTRIHHLVREKQPNCLLHIVGTPVHYIPEWIRENAKNLGVNILGYVKDVRPLFNSVLATVAPLRFGAGVKGKIGQSLAYGVPVVSTAVGAEGMHLTELEVGIGRDEREFARVITSLHQNKTYWEMLRTGGQRVIKEKYSKEAAMQGIQKILRKAEHAVPCQLERTMKRRFTPTTSEEPGTQEYPSFVDRSRTRPPRSRRRTEDRVVDYHQALLDLRPRPDTRRLRTMSRHQLEPEEDIREYIAKLERL